MAIQASELISEWVQQGAFDHAIAAASIVLVTEDGSLVTVANIPHDVNARLLAEVAATMVEGDDEGEEE